jgi:hypothetical protein
MRKRKSESLWKAPSASGSSQALILGITFATSSTSIASFAIAPTFSICFQHFFRLSILVENTVHFCEASELHGLRSAELQGLRQQPSYGIAAQLHEHLRYLIVARVVSSDFSLLAPSKKFTKVRFFFQFFSF